MSLVTGPHEATKKKNDIGTVKRVLPASLGSECICELESAARSVTVMCVGKTHCTLS